MLAQIGQCLRILLTSNPVREEIIFSFFLIFFNYEEVGVQSLFDDSQKKSLDYGGPKKANTVQIERCAAKTRS